MIEKMKFSELLQYIKMCIEESKTEVLFGNSWSLSCRAASNSSNPDDRVFVIWHKGLVKKYLCITGDSDNEIVRVLINNKEDLINLGFVDDISDVSY